MSRLRSKLNQEIHLSDHVMSTPGMALKTVISKSGLGVYASSDLLYRGGVFGRDSLEVAEDLMLTKPKLVRRILVTLAKLQGADSNAKSEEEPGKIIHEYRTKVVDGKPINAESERIFDTLSAKWGTKNGNMAYYGSVDATPHFIRVLCTYCTLYDISFLHKKIIRQNGEEATIQEVLEAALNWTIGKLQDSQFGMLEYKRVNPDGILNQVWKDSSEFYVHSDGTAVNHEMPVGSIEVQGLVYDALILAADILEDRGEELRRKAEQLRKTILNVLWLKEASYFALGYDYTDDGVRLIKTRTANPAALLDTLLFENLSTDSKRDYLTGIVTNILSPDFLTDAGIRSRALSESRLVGFWDYHGSFVSWIKETYDISKGLRRQGFPGLSRQLENRILNVCLRFGAYPEFVYVDAAGRVLASRPKRQKHGNVILINGTNQPERIQAWTVSAVYAIVADRIKNKVKRPKVNQEQWQRLLEEELLLSIPRVDRHFNPIKLSARYPSYPYSIKKHDM